MNTLRHHPFRVLGTLLAAAICCFLLSASGQSGSFWSSGPGWLGAIGWFAFVALLLGFVAAAVYASASAVLRRRAA